MLTSCYISIRVSWGESVCTRQHISEEIYGHARRVATALHIWLLYYWHYVNLASALPPIWPCACSNHTLFVHGMETSKVCREERLSASVLEREGCSELQKRMSMAWVFSEWWHSCWPRTRQRPLPNRCSIWIAGSSRTVECCERHYKKRTRVYGIFQVFNTWWKTRCCDM